MPFTVPNLPNIIAAGGSAEQAEPDAVDFEILGDDRFGVISGGDITQQGTPDMTMAMTASVVLVNGSIFNVGGGSVSFSAAEGQPRYDLVVVNNNGAYQVIKGVAAVNSVLPAWPHTSTVMHAVYVAKGVSTLLTSNAVDKRRQVEPVFRRRAAAGTDIQLDLGTTAGGSLFATDASGKLLWENGTADITLQRSTANVLAVAGQLLAQTLVTTVPTLVAKALAAQTAALQEWQNVSGAAVAKIDVSGEFTALNFRTGTGSPQGVVTAPAGALYTDKGGDANAASVGLWVKESGTDNSGWAQVAAFNPPVAAFPVGGIFAWYGGSTPSGFIAINGASVNSATYPDLAAVWGFSGTYTMPDFRGRVLVANSPGSPHFDTAAALTGGQEYVTLSGANLPAWTPTLSISTYTHGHSVSASGSGTTSPGGAHDHGWSPEPFWYNSQVFSNLGLAGGGTIRAATWSAAPDHGHGFSVNVSGGAAADTHGHSASVTNWPGTSASHENTQPYHRVLHWLVKAVA